MTSEIMLAFKSRSSDQYHNGAISGVIHPTWKWRRDLPLDDVMRRVQRRIDPPAGRWQLEIVPNMRSESSRTEALPMEVSR